MACLQIVLRVPWADCSGAVLDVSASSRRYLATEHEADDEIANTHIHLAIEPNITKEGIRKKLIKHSLGGQKHSIMEKVLKTHEKYEFMALAKYCIKGDKTQIRHNSLSLEETDELARTWVNRTKKLDVDLTKHDIITKETVVIASTTLKSEWDKLLDAYETVPDNKKMNMAELKRWIKCRYLTQRRPIPREGDTNRYAYSLWAIGNNKTCPFTINEAETQAARYIG